MKQRPQTWNGTVVPYRTPTHDLIVQAESGESNRWAAFVALAHDPSPAAIAFLRKSVRSDDPHVRRSAVEAVACHPLDAENASLISSALRDSAGAVVRTACGAAASLMILEAHDALLVLVKASYPSTRCAALRALSDLWRPRDFDMVFDTFRTDRSPEVRKEAAWTLRRHVTKETWRTLFDAWHHDSLHRHRCWACEIAADFGGPDLAESLSQLGNDEDGLVRRAAKDALSRVGAV